MFVKRFLESLTGVLVLAAAPSFAQDTCQAPLRVLSSNGVKAVLEQTHAELESSIGCRLLFEFSTVASLARRIEAGESFDVAVLVPALLDSLANQNIVAPESAQTFARTGVGVGARAGALDADVSTTDGLRRTLLDAASVVFTAEGQSRRTIDAAFEALGIAESMRPRTILLGPGEGPPAVVAGRAELVLTLVSEILPVPGLELVGPFPEALQGYVSFAAAVREGSPEPSPARAFIAALGRAPVTDALRVHGVEPVRD